MKHETFIRYYFSKKFSVQVFIPLIWVTYVLIDGFLFLSKWRAEANYTVKTMRFVHMKSVSASKVGHKFFIYKTNGEITYLT